MTNVRQQPPCQKCLVLQIFHSSTYKRSTISVFLCELQYEMLMPAVCKAVRLFLPFAAGPALFPRPEQNTILKTCIFFLRALLPPRGIGQNQQQMLCVLHRSLTDVTSEMWDAQRGVGGSLLRLYLCATLKSLLCGISDKSAPSLVRQQWQSQW